MTKSLLVSKTIAEVGTELNKLKLPPPTSFINKWLKPPESSEKLYFAPPASTVSGILLPVTLIAEDEIPPPKVLVAVVLVAVM